MTYDLPANVTIGLFCNFLDGKSAFSNCNAGTWVTSNFACLNINLRSSVCSAVHVQLYWDLNNEPPYGCPEIVSLVIRSG